MRFHLGFIFNWKTIKKWLIPILIGVLLLFSQKLNVYAFDIANYSPKSQDLVWSNIQSATFTTLSDGLQGSNFSFDSDYYVTHDLLVFPFSSGFSTQSQASTYDYSYWWYKHVDNFIVYAMTNDSIGYIPCQVEEGLILCSAKGYTITGINFRFRVINKPIANGSAYSDMNYIWIQFDPRVHTFDRISSNQDIIDNNNQNTQDIIDNNNHNTQDIIDSNKVCSYYDSNSIIEYGYLNSSGIVVSGNNNIGVTDFISVKDSEVYIDSIFSGGNANFCFYNYNKNLISCSPQINLSPGLLTIPNNSFYFRGTISVSSNKPTYRVCKSGNQAITDSITDSSLGSGSSGSAYFGDNIWEKNYGLSSLLTIPLDLVNSITTKTCSNLVLDLPFLNNKTITLPCISTIIQTNFQQLFDLYQIIIGGIICYNCALHIYRDVENALDPESNMSIAGYFV